MSLNQQLRTLQSLPVPAYMCDLDGRILGYNDRILEIWGRDPLPEDRYCPSRLASPNNGRPFPIEDGPLYRTLQFGEAQRDCEIHILRSDGALLHLVVNTSPIRNENGELIAALCIAHDVTDLRESQNIFKTIFDQTSIGVVLLNEDGTIRAANPFFTQLLGVTEAEAIGRHYTFVLPEDECAPSAALFVELMSGSVSTSTVIRRLRKVDGAIVTTRIVLTVTSDPCERPTMLCMVHDITEDCAKERQLQKSREFVSKLSESNILCVASFRESDGAITDCNDAFVQLLGYSRDEFLNGNVRWQDYTSPESHAVQLNALEQLKLYGYCEPFEKENIHKNGARISVVVAFGRLDSTGDCVAWILNITRQRELERHIEHASKMEAIGQLAGGIAHDFNNLLMVIGAQAELLEMNTSISSRDGLTLRRIAQAVDRAKQMTGKLLTFSRGQELSTSDFVLAPVIQECIDLIRISIPRNISVSLTSTERCIVTADRSLIEQALMNLMLNARDAMQEGGTIQISLDRLSVFEEERGLHEAIPVGNYALVRVSDTGHGINPEHLPRIFEPFFTTKPRGRGTGLGLAVVYGSVKQNGGFIRVQSAPGAGTTFYLYFPLASCESRSAPEGAKCIFEATTGGRVLLIEDESQLRQTIAALLSAEGFTVVTAESAEQALDIVDSDTMPFDLLLTDSNLPGNSGSYVATEMRKNHPELPVILISGYASAKTTAAALDKVVFLQKPVSRNQLVKAVRDGIALEA